MPSHGHARSSSACDSGQTHQAGVERARVLSVASPSMPPILRGGSHASATVSWLRVQHRLAGGLDAGRFVLS